MTQIYKVLSPSFGKSNITVSWNSANSLCYFTIFVSNSTWFQWFELLLSYNFQRGPQFPCFNPPNSLQFFYANIFILFFVLLKYFYRFPHIGFCILVFGISIFEENFPGYLMYFFLSFEKNIKSMKLGFNSELGNTNFG